MCVRAKIPLVLSPVTAEVFFFSASVVVAANHLAPFLRTTTVTQECHQSQIKFLRPLVWLWVWGLGFGLVPGTFLTSIRPLASCPCCGLGGCLATTHTTATTGAMTSASTMVQSASTTFLGRLQVLLLHLMTSLSLDAIVCVFVCLLCLHFFFKKKTWMSKCSAYAAVRLCVLP